MAGCSAEPFCDDFRVPRAEMQKRKESFKSEQAERKEKITQQKQELSDEIEMFEAALEEVQIVSPSSNYGHVCFRRRKIASFESELKCR